MQLTSLLTNDATNVTCALYMLLNVSFVNSCQATVNNPEKCIVFNMKALFLFFFLMQA